LEFGILKQFPAGPLLAFSKTTVFSAFAPSFRWSLAQMRKIWLFISKG
jgi:hypothetical protein